MGVFRRDAPAVLPEPPEPRWSNYALAVRLGWTVEQVHVHLEGLGCQLAPAGPFGEMCPTESDCKAVVRLRDEQMEAEARHEARLASQEQHVPSGGGVVTLIDRPGPEREALIARAAEMDKTRQMNAVRDL